MPTSKRKPTGKRKPRKKTVEPHNQGYVRELSGFMVIGFGVMMLVGIFSSNKEGIFGAPFRDMVFGALGLLGYVAPFLLMIGGACMIADMRVNLRRWHLIAAWMLIICSITFSHLLYIDGILHDSYQKFIDDSYYQGYLQMSGFGGLGAIVSFPFYYFFGRVLTNVICWMMGVASLFVLLDASIRDVLGHVGHFGKSLWDGIVNNLGQRSYYAREAVYEEYDDQEEQYSPQETPQHPVTAQEQHPVKMLDPPAPEPPPVMEPDPMPPVAFEEEAPGPRRRAKTSETISQGKPGPRVPVQREIQVTEISQGRPVGFVEEEMHAVESKASQENEVKDAPQPRYADAASRYDDVIEHLPDRPPEDQTKKEKIQREMDENQQHLSETLEAFGIKGVFGERLRGPAITRYEFRPDRGIKVSRIVGLSDDLALSLASYGGVRIEAPIPGKPAVGIEVPNKEISMVYLREVLKEKGFREYPSNISFGLGRDIAGKTIIADLARMPHLLIAGATGSGKSVCINTLISSILIKASPDQVRLIMIDPKVVELSIYNGVPHLLVPVVTDPKKAAGALNWAVQEMTTRYKLFADRAVRDIMGFNTVAKRNGEVLMPQIVVIIDELADLMMVAPGDVEDAICRLAQLARAAGIHLVIATQRPSVNVITGVIKANIPSRIAFAVASQVDSRTILDMAGAEKLLGRGDMLYYPSGVSKPQRVQGAFFSDEEVQKLVKAVCADADEMVYDEATIQSMEAMAQAAADRNPGKKEKMDDGVDPSGDVDELLPRAVDIVMDTGAASISMIQRRLRVGYARASRLVDEMELRGIVSGFEGSKSRSILMTREQVREVLTREMP